MTKINVYDFKLIKAKDNMSKRSRARSVASQKDGFDENKSINMSRNEPEKSMGMY